MKKDRSSPILSCYKLAVGYKDKTVLENLTLDFAPGQFISLLGPNGAGKTTLLRTLSRHLHPLHGSVEIQGKPLEEMSPMTLAQFMAVVLTEKVSPPLFTVFEFVALGRYPHTGFLGRLGRRDYEIVNNALAAVNADTLARRAFSDLSDGERQKALVARALVQEPRLLLLDEPTLHLDLKHRMEVMIILRNLCRSQGITVVASLHDVDVAAKVSDRVALIKDGGMSAYGIPETVLNSEVVADLYDFSDARFSSRLGGIEFRGTGRIGKAFILAGSGTGALVYRLMVKRGFHITTGILYDNDVDFYVARSLGAECITRPPAMEDSGKTIEQAMDLLDACDTVIDCGSEAGPLASVNQQLLQNALKKGKTVFCLQNAEKSQGSGNCPNNTAICCRDAGDLIDALEQRFPMNGIQGDDEKKQVMEVQ